MRRALELSLLPVALNALIALATPVNEHNAGFDSDGVYYGAMALADERLYDLAHTAPFCWRPLTPWLAAHVAEWLPGEYASPGDRILAGFRTLAFASNCVTLAALLALLQTLGFSATAANAGALLYAGIFWTIKFSYYSPAYIDFQTQMFVMLALLCTAARRYWLLPPLLAIAACQKEPTLCVLPAVLVHYWHSGRRVRPAALIWTALVVAAPVAAMFVIRSRIAAVNSYDAVDVWVSMITLQVKDVGGWPWLLSSVFSGLGILPAMLIAFAGHAWRFLVRSPHWLLLALCAVPLLFGAYEKARYFLFLASPLALAATAIVNVQAAQLSARVAGWLLVTVLAQFYLGHQFEAMGSFDDYLARMVPIRPELPVATIALLRGVGVSVAWLIATWALVGRARSIRAPVAPGGQYGPGLSGRTPQ